MENPNNQNSVSSDPKGFRETEHPHNDQSLTISSENGGIESSTEKHENQSFSVVGLGASAGGLEALEKFFSNMPPDSGMAFVVVVHLDPTHKTLMPELLARYTRMEVCSAEEGMFAEPNMIYIIPKNRDLTISGGQFHLELPQTPRGARHTIDIFLRSLATDMNENTIAVILSGTGTDGTQGIKAVKEVGGFVAVQDATDAKYPGMPQSAIDTGLADIIYAVDKLPEKIIEISLRSIHLVQRKGTEQEDNIRQQLKSVLQVVHTSTGHDFSTYKMSTILRRTQRRMAVNNFGGLDDYIDFLSTNHGECKALFNEFLIGVTNFFRNPEAFEALERQILPQLFDTRKQAVDPLRIWVAGCATGEEAYSIGILLSEYCREQRLDLKVQIFASDIDAHAINIARAGVYPDSIGTDVSQRRLNSFFTKEGSTYKVGKSLREMILFAQHSITKDPPFSRIDLLICRNLLIYFSPNLQKRIIPLFAQAIKPNGFMLLGSSETVGNFTDLFLPLDKRWKLFQRRELKRRVTGEYQFAPHHKTVPDGGSIHRHSEEKIDPGVLAEKILMQRYSPPCVVINEKLEIVYFPNRTHRYLEPPVGEPNQSIMKMVREGLRPALRAAIHKATTDQQPAIYRNLKGATDGGTDTLDLRVEPITTPASAKGLALVIFEPAKTLPQASAIAVPKEVSTTEKETSQDLMVKQLEEQLLITNEQLQSTIEQMENANEELKSSNEELLSMNEEFQSTNEELETSKEELQALNEELVTVNAELQSKVEELGQTNSDLENFHTSSDIAIIFLDRDFRVKRFSPAMAKLFNLLPSDIGRSLHYFSRSINYPDLQEDMTRVLEDLAPLEREVFDDQQQRYYLVRVLPYRTTENIIDGIVVSFVDFTERKHAEESRDRLASIVENSTDAIIGKNLDGTITSWNQGAETMYGYSTVEAIGRHISIIAPAEKHDEITIIQDKVKKQEKIENFETTRQCKDGRLVNVSLVISPILDNSGRVVGASSIARDTTKRMAMEKALRESELLYRGIGESIDYGIWICTPDGRNMYASQSFLDLVGITQEQCSDFGWGDLLHPDDAAATVTAWKECVRTSSVWDIEHRYRGVDGEYHPILARGVPIRDEQGHVIYWAGINLDIGKLKRTEQKLQTLLAEKEILLKEIHHRVKNNLQVISSLVNLQSNNLTEESIRREFDDTCNRIRTMALIHEKMYQTKELIRLNFCDYATDLLQSLWKSHSVLTEKIQLNLVLAPVMLSIEVAVPCGLILNELATNVFKHAFIDEDDDCELTVELSHDSATEIVCLRVTDNGCGLPAELDWRDTSSLGLRLVQILAKQLGGNVEKGDGPGADFRLTFPHKGSQHE